MINFKKESFPGLVDVSVVEVQEDVDDVEVSEARGDEECRGAAVRGALVDVDVRVREELAEHVRMVVLRGHPEAGRPVAVGQSCEKNEF